MTQTITYYNYNAKEFSKNTKNIIFTEIQDKFLGYLEPKSKLLDFGCGSGRDTKYFLEHGFQVDAIDGSEELCKIASKFIGIEVNCKLFQELDCKAVYDGVWACASILHISTNDLQMVFAKIAEALKEQGVFYTSFKYGTFEGIRKGRYFTDMNHEKIQMLLRKGNLFEVEEMWVTSDVRKEREEEKWLNLILRKSFQSQK